MQALAMPCVPLPADSLNYSLAKNLRMAYSSQALMMSLLFLCLEAVALEPVARKIIVIVALWGSAQLQRGTVYHSQWSE